MSYKRAPSMQQGKPGDTAAPVYPFFLGAFLALSVFFAVIGFIYLDIRLALTWFLAASAATFILTGYDKAVAGKGDLRVPEAVLFTGALLGGAPGLLLGMKLFRHKTKKASFQLVLAVIIVIQVAVWHYFLKDF